MLKFVGENKRNFIDFRNRVDLEVGRCKAITIYSDHGSFFCFSIEIFGSVRARIGIYLFREIAIVETYV